MDEISELVRPVDRAADPPLPAGGRLLSLTRPLPVEVPSRALLRLSTAWRPFPAAEVGTGPRTYWADPKGSTAGIGAAVVLTASGLERFSRLWEQAQRLFSRAHLDAEGEAEEVGPRLVGGFAFRAGREEQGIWRGFPEAYLLLPRYQLTRRGEETWLTVNRLAKPGESLDRAYEQLVEEHRALRGVLSEPGGRPPRARRKTSLGEIEYLIDPSEWQELVEAITERIRSGELAKVVLAQACRVLTDPPVDPLDVLADLERRYPNCYRFLIEPTPGCAFYGATPELLAEVEGQRVRAVALAGSIRRGASPAEDERLAQELLHSEKNRHEHALVVEAVRESLRPLTRTLRAEGPTVVRFTNIQHLQTVIEGELDPPEGVLPVVEALHPTPAVGGVPRERALELIEELEPFSRGGYASPVGWLDLRGNGVFVVALRSAVTRGRETRLYAGAGIVADSDPAQEWEETLLKLQPVLEALQSASAYRDRGPSRRTPRR